MFFAAQPHGFKLLMFTARFVETISAKLMSARRRRCFRHPPCGPALGHGHGPSVQRWPTALRAGSQGPLKSEGGTLPKKDLYTDL